MSADRDLDPSEVAALLGEGGWYPSNGIGAGVHWRRGREHLRQFITGYGRVHVDAYDPAEAPVRHVVVDAGPVALPFVLGGLVLGFLAAGR